MSFLWVIWIVHFFKFSIKLADVHFKELNCWTLTFKTIVGSKKKKKTKQKKKKKKKKNTTPINLLMDTLEKKNQTNKQKESFKKPPKHRDF